MVSQTWTFYSLTQLPVHRFDVIWCKFPFHDEPSDQPSQKKERPALVRDVRVKKNGDCYIEVCYGTSNPERYSGADLFVFNATEMAFAGLPQATTFLLRKTLVIPWAEEWCTVRPDGTGPVVGRLSDNLQEHVRYLMQQG